MPTEILMEVVMVQEMILITMAMVLKKMMRVALMNKLEAMKEKELMAA
jgi:hypothetical protein